MVISSGWLLCIVVNPLRKLEALKLEFFNEVCGNFILLNSRGYFSLIYIFQSLA